MAATESTQKRIYRTYGNWRKPASAGLLGMCAVGTAIMFVGLLVVIVVMMSRGPLDALVTAVILITLLGLMMIRDSHGKNALSRISTRIGW